MKIKTLAALCRKNKAFCLYDSQTESGEDGGQWLGDGRAAYPIAGLPYLEEESIYTLFDITDKQQSKILFRHEPLPGGINFEDVDPAEQPLEREKLSLAVDGKILEPLQTRRGVVFIDAAYLSPLADAADMLELYERRTEAGGTYIAAKLGLLLVGIIFPYDLIREEFVEKVETLLRQCRVALEDKKRRAEIQEREGAEHQTTFGEQGENDGE